MAPTTELLFYDQFTQLSTRHSVDSSLDCGSSDLNLTVADFNVITIGKREHNSF